MYISLLISFYVHLDGFSTKVQTITFAVLVDTKNILDWTFSIKYYNSHSS